MKRIARLVFVMLLTGCQQTPQRIDTPRTEGLDKSYTVDLPTGWIRQGTFDNKTLLASRNGFLLEFIAIAKRPLKEAFPMTKKAATEGMLPAELAELEIAEIKSSDQFTAALTVVENEPAEIAGRDGFRIQVSYKNARGLELQRVVYGFIDKTGYYQLAFQAPMLYYFGTYYPDFEKAVASFQLSGDSKKTSGTRGSPLSCSPSCGNTVALFTAGGRKRWRTDTR
jgi:hypothetical protein